MAGHLNQYLNWRALSTVLHAVTRQPALVLPHHQVDSVSEIDFAELRRLGVRAIVMDKDNTLTEPYALAAHPSAHAGLAAVHRHFPNAVVIFSNSIGDVNDARSGYVRAKEVEQSLGVPVLRHSEQKPEGGCDAIKAHFGLASCAEVALVGDRYLTDIVFGNRHGMFTIRTAPFAPEKDNVMVRAVRRFEDWFVARARAQGLAAPCWSPPSASPPE